MDRSKIARFVWNTQRKAGFLRCFGVDRTISGGYTMPEGCYVNQWAGGVTPKKIRREQKVTFLDALKFRKAEKSPKNKKDPIWVGCGGEGFPLVEGWSDGVDPSDLTDRNRAGCNGTVADLGGLKPRFL